MKRLIALALACSALAVAVPASAHPDDYGRGYDDRRYGDYDRSGASLRTEFSHLEQGIRHGLGDGSMSEWQARRFQGEIWRLRQLEQRYRYQNYGYLSAWQYRDLQSRLTRLHQVMHIAHEEGHENNDDWNR